MKKLLKNAIVVTMDTNNTVWKKGWVLVNGSVIEALGEGEYNGDTAETEVIDMSGKLVMPGFVNAHSHFAGSLFKGLLEDDPNGFYGYALPMEINLTAEDVYYLSLAGSYESLASGITTANEIYHFADAVAQAACDIGIRAIVAQNIVDTDISRLRYNDYTRDAKKGEAFLEDNIALIEKYHGKDNGRIACRVGPHATDTVSMELAKKCVQTAEKYGVGLHMHTAQSPRENRVVMEQYGLTPVEYMKQVGELGPQTMAAHCVYVNDNDIKLMAESGMHMVHCTKSFAKDSAFAPMQKILDAGVDVTLGTDWVTMDPWMNIRYAVGINRHHNVCMEYTSSEFLLRKFTIEAAKALGLGNITGSLERGKQADIQVIDMQQPHLLPVFHDVLPLLVHNCTRSDVCDVMVRGKFVIRNRILTTMNQKDILLDTQKTADRLYAFRVV